MTRLRWVPVLLLVCLIGLPACSSSSKPTACTEIGCSSGANLNLDAFTRSGRTVTQATVCVNAHCETQRGTTTSPLAFASATSTIARTAVVTVKVVLKGADGSVLASSSIATRLRKVQPNGPKCQPICFVANVHLTSEGTLAPGSA